MGIAQQLFADGSIYGMGGTGVTSQGDSTGLQGGQFGMRHDVSKNSIVDFLYYNEGTPANNHRDGFAVMNWYRQPITNNLTIEAGAGPYLSMNTTTVDDQQINKKNLGALVGLAALYRIYGSQFYLTTRYTHAQVPGSVDTDTLYVGGGYYYQDAERDPSDGSEMEISALGGNSQTTREHSQMAKGFQIEVKKLATDHVAYSVSVNREGDSTVTNRTGVVTQVWYVTPTKDDQWTFSVGAGPYIVQDEREENKTRLAEVTSLEAAKKMNKTWKVAVRFNRVISTNNKDQDMFYIGLQKKLR